MDSESLFSCYFDISPTPSLLCTSNGRIIRANAAMAQIIGVPAATTLTGKAVTELITLAEPRLIHAAAIQQGTETVDTTATLTAGHLRHTIRLRLQPLVGNEGNAVLVTLIPPTAAHQHTPHHCDKETLSLILDAVSDGIWDWNVLTGEVYRSPGWLRMFHYDNHGADVAAWTSLIHPDDIDRVTRKFNAHLEQQSDIYECEYRMRTADGQWKWTQDRGRVVERDAQGNVLRMIGAHQDIDQRKQAELALTAYRDSLEMIVSERTAELERAKEDAVRANRSKSDFLTTISHEIRTPMNAVLGMVTLLKQKNPSPEQLEYLNIIDSSGEMLLTLIDDVLDLSKVEAGRLVLEEIESDLHQEINSVVTLMRTVADKKSLSLTLIFNGVLPTRVLCDAHRLRQILFNLIGNAIKFTQKGGVYVEVTATPAREGRHQVIISVMDTGIGISAEMQKLIFEAFTQADTSINRNYGGTGLGLSICAKLIELMKGEIKVDSRPGQGSKFTIELELAGAQHSTDHVTVQSGDTSAPFPLTILTVDDDAINRMVVSRLLAHCGHSVVAAASADDAIESIQRQTFDLILMDIHMPGINGIEATRKIRALEEGRYRDVPIIALSANVLTDTIELCRESGMNGHLSKPILTEELFSLLNSLGR